MKKNKVEGRTISDLGVYYQAPVTETVWEWHEDRDVDWWCRIHNLETDLKKHGQLNEWSPCCPTSLSAFGLPLFWILDILIGVLWYLILSCMWLSYCSSTICGEIYFPFELPRCLCWKSIDHNDVSLFLYSVFSSHWSVSLFLCKYKTASISVAL